MNRPAFSDFFSSLERVELSDTADAFRKALADSDRWVRHGDFAGWMDRIASMPVVAPSRVILDSPVVTVGGEDDCDIMEREEVRSALRVLMPWRKGPYMIHGIFIDTEWRSDWKWARVEPHITSLEGRMVLDVGCGNGYHCWRMYGAGAAMVAGIDPAPLYLAQFEAFRHFAGRSRPVHLLPLADSDLPDTLSCFDTVFSMGVLYHRRSPFDHMIKLGTFLRPAGELILETLVIDGGEGEVLVPSGRYAKMRNVWFVPSCLTLEKWLERAGFSDIRVVDVTRTTIEEQRKTEWMEFESLSDFLDPSDHDRTVEGYPAPVRAVFVCNKR